MSEEQDSWFKSAFGLDLGEAANKVSEGAAAVGGAVAGAASAAFEDVKTAAEAGAAAAGGVGAAVKKAAEGVLGPAVAAAKKAAAGIPGAGGGPEGAGGGGAAGSFPLGASVGRGGKNAPNDVRAVQRALGIGVDGQCGSQTIGAIEAFQRKMGTAKPDGRVDAGGATERALAGGGGGRASDDPSSPSSGLPTGKRQHEPFSVTENIEGVSEDEVEGGVDVAADISKTSPDDPIAERIIQILNAGGNLGQTIAGLRNQDMRRILDVMTHLRRAGKLEEFSQAVPGSGHERIVVAIRTILPNFDEIWRRILASLGSADRTAILERTPQVVRTEVGGDPAAPSSKGGQDQEHGGGSAEVGSEGLAVQGDLLFHSALFGRPVPGKVTVELKPDGTLGKVEVDLKALKQKLSTTKLGPALDLQASLSLKASVVLGQKDTRTILEGVKGKIKGEVSATFTNIPVLKTLTLKLSAAVGKDGKFEVVPAIEIPLP